MSDWYISLSYNHKRNRTVDMNVKYTANAIQDLCEIRDLHNFERFDHTQIKQFIQYLCTK